MKSIELTNEQYEILLRLVYIGNWMVNGYRVGDEQIKEYEEVERHIFNQADQFDLEHLLIIDEQGIYPNADFEFDEQMREYMELYDDNNFWDQLSTRFAEREAVATYTKKQLKAMSREERFLMITSLEDKYKEEFCKHGIEHLHLIT